MKAISRRKQITLLLCTISTCSVLFLWVDYQFRLTYYRPLAQHNLPREVYTDLHLISDTIYGQFVLLHGAVFVSLLIVSRMLFLTIKERDT